MFAYPFAPATLLILGQSGSSSAAATHKQEMEFIRAMKKSSMRKSRASRSLSSKNHNEFKAVLNGISKKSSELYKSIINKSTAVKPGEGRKRKLQNYNNYDDKSGTDDYFMTYGEWKNSFGFDATQYSLSYHRCAEVRQFDDQVAAQEDTDSVFTTKRFAVFRFCPEATCMGYMEEDFDCGCESQCETLAEHYGDDDDDEDYEACEEACEDQCESFWSYQYRNQGDRTYQQEDADEDKAKMHWNGSDSYSFNMSYANEQRAKEDEQNTLGARGKGCQSNYGEYMIEIEDYLSLMIEFQEERFDTYCEYCAQCMLNVYHAWLEMGGDNNNYRKLTFEDFKNSEEHQKMARELGGNVNGGQANAGFYNVCPEYDTCSEYQKTCKQGMDKGYSGYFECAEVENVNGQVAYIGPHCGGDSFTITLGVYSDEYCNEYIGNGVDIASFLGEELDIEEDTLKSYYNSANGAMDVLKYSNEDDVCIPCRKADMPYEEYEYEASNDDLSAAQMNYGNNEITEICENLYLASARCDKHFRSYTSKSKQAKFAEVIAQEELTCDFIDSVTMGNYNEMGFEQKQSGWLADNMYTQQYGRYISEVNPYQIFGLVMSILAVIILSIWSLKLQNSLSKRRAWRPRRGLNNVEPSQHARVSRHNSGIVMGRSQGKASYYLS